MTLPAIDDLTQLERQALLFSLLDNVIGSVVMPDKKTVVVPFGAEVRAGEKITVQSGPYLRFQPVRLLILEPTVERITRQWSHRKKRVATTRMIEHRQEQTIRRSVWTIDGIAVGQRIQFMSYASFSGDAFSPDNPLTFTDICEPAVAISISVHHSCTDVVPFRAVVLGVRLDGAEPRDRMTQLGSNV